MNIILRNRPVKVVFMSDPHLDGVAVDGCVDHQETTSPVLILRSGLSLFELVDTLLHEMGHFYFPDLNEEVITQFGTEFASVLLQLDLLHDPRQAKDSQTFLQ